MTDLEKTLKVYSNKLIEFKSLHTEDLNILKEKRDELLLELEISIRVWHTIEHSYITSQMDIVTEVIDMLEKYDFNLIPKDKI